MIKIIAVIGRNGEMGIGNELLGHYPEDMEHFRKETKSHMVLIGSNTYRHLPEAAKPFPNRFTLVLTSNPKKFKEIPNEMSTVTNFKDAVAMYKYARNMMKRELPDFPLHMYIAGGAKVYKELITKHAVEELVITQIDLDFPDANHYFPAIRSEDWELYNEEKIGESLTLKRYKRIKK